MFTKHKILKYLFSHNELNMRQRRWLKFLKHYDFKLEYHPGKANVVANALCRKSTGLLASLMMPIGRLVEAMSNLDLVVHQK